VVQVTVTRSACSIAFGKGPTTAEPGSAQHLIVVVSDVERRATISSHALPPSANRFASTAGLFRARTRRVVRTRRWPRSATRNEWLIQEIKTWLPGREWN
jgi:hypothetical protein